MSALCVLKKKLCSPTDEYKVFADWIFAKLTQARDIGKRNFTGENVPTRLAYRQIYRAFSWLMIAVEGSKTLCVVSTLNRWSWVV